MTGRQLSLAEHRQRARAALKSGAFSGVRIRDLSAVLYDRHLWRLQQAHGPTTPRQRFFLRDIADYDAQIALADEWLDQQGDPLFKDRRAGELHSIVDKRDGWARSRAALIDKLPEGAADRFDGLASLGSKRRRNGLGRVVGSPR